MTQQAQEEPLELESPNAVDAERTLLGAVLLDVEAWARIRQRLSPGDFYLEAHRRIGGAISRLRKQDPPGAIDIVTVSNELKRTHELEAVDGVSYLSSLTEGLPRRPEIDDYIGIVKDKSLLRQIISLGDSATRRAADGQDGPLAILGDMASQIEAITATTGNIDAAPIQNFIVDAIAEINAEYQSRLSPCIPSGNNWFDAKTGGGYRHGKITLVCARPNVGKTPWAITSTAYNCARGRKVVFFSLEMEKNEILRNLVPYVVDLPNIVVNRPWMQSPTHNQLVNQAMNTLVEWPLSVYDGEMDADKICWTIDRETRKGEEVLFCLDHFGLISGGSTKARDTRERYNENSSRLRRKIKHKKAALLILCQLRKVNREYADKQPIPDDVKESGNMWEDAFAGLLIHRGFEKESVRMSKEATLNLAKLRSGGSPGDTKANFSTRRLEFEAEVELNYNRNEDEDF